MTAKARHKEHMKKFTRTLSIILILLTLFATVAPCISVGAETTRDLTEERENAHVKDTEPIYTREYSFQSAEKALENDALLDILYPKFTALRSEIGTSFGNPSETFGGLSTSGWHGSESIYLPELSADHPRLLVTKDTIPTIRKALEESNPTNERFFAILDMDVSLPRAALTNGVSSDIVKNGVANGGINNGKLGTAADGFFKRAGMHNYDGYYLEVIQAKALGYLIDGHELYGYQAIHCMKQVLDTLDIQIINSNQEREFGNVMFTAALVFDWCYDLLTDTDRDQLIAGVEYKVGKVKNDYGTSFSIKFPPTKVGAVSGHGSERQLLRDMLAAAIAFYGYNGNNWYQWIGTLFYEHYVPVRNYYFESGISQQGVGTYASGRHIADMFSAWIMMTAAEKAEDKYPYKNIHTTIRSFLGYETTPGLIYTDGDGGGKTQQQNNYEFRAMAYMTAYLFEDEPMLAQARSMRPTVAFGKDMRIDITIEIQSPLYVALTGMSDITPADDKYEGMELIQYNGSPVGQYVTHEAYGVTDSASVFMRLKEVTTANHEHADAGNFMIYYKGMLSADNGWYDGYSSNHNRYYHQATVSHNSLLIYNPDKPGLSGNDATYYSGGQKWPAEGSTLADLKSSSLKTGTILGREHGYYDAEQTQPKYAYIGGNITPAYNSNTVSFVGRRMLVVYTGDETVPMAFFTYDRISSQSTSYKKYYLFHISSPNKPTIGSWTNTTNKTIKTENGGGQLVLTCLSSNASYRIRGGTTYGNYYVNSTVGNVATPKGYDDGTYGRIEIYNPTNETTTSFLNAMYVTDAGNTTYYETKPVTNVSTNIASAGDVEGGVFNNSIAAIFVKKNITNTSAYNTDTISFTTTGTNTLQYYVDGMGSGSWKVTVDGNLIGSFPVSKEGRILTFDAPAGNVVLTWEGSGANTVGGVRKALYDSLGEKLANTDGLYTADSYAAYCTAYDAIKAQISTATATTSDMSALEAIDVATLKANAEGLLVDEVVLKKNELKAILGDKKLNSGGIYSDDSYSKYSNAYDAILTSINNSTTVEELNAIDVATLKTAAEAYLISSFDDKQAALLTALGSKKANTGYSQSSYTEYSNAYDSIKASIQNATTVEELNNINVPALKSAAEAKLVTLVDAKKAELLTELGTKKPYSSSYSDDVYAEYSQKYDEILAYINNAESLTELNAIDVTAQILSAESKLFTTLDAKKEYLLDALGEKASGSGTDYDAYSSSYDEIVASINNATTTEELDALDIPAAKAAAENKMVASLDEGKAVLLAALGAKLESTGYTTASYTQYSNKYDELLSSINSATSMEELNSVEFATLKTAAVGVLIKTPWGAETSTVVGDGATSETDVLFSYEKFYSSMEVFNIDVLWSDLSFTYTPTSPIWDPSNHSYSSSEGNWNDPNGKVTVANHSNAAVAVTVNFERASTANGTATLTLTNSSFTLISAVNTKRDEAPSGVTNIEASGVPTSGNVIGTVKVSIQKST